MKNLKLLPLLILFSCQKEGLLPEQNVSEVSTTILSDIISGAVETITYEGGLVQKVTPLSAGKASVIFQLEGKKMQEVIYKETKVIGYTIVGFYDLTGSEYYSFKVNVMRKIYDFRVVKPMPVDQLGLDKMTWGQCMASAFSVCGKSWLCSIGCTLGAAWTSCTIGWSAMCMCKSCQKKVTW